jgi:subtilisin
MPRDANHISRRSVLKTTGGALGVLSATGIASAGPNDLVEVNVGYRNSSGQQAVASAASNIIRSFAFNAKTVRLPKRAITVLTRNPAIRYVEENGQMHAIAQTLPYGVDRVDAEVAHTNGDTGNGADIAILDTGIDSDHPDLQANLGSGKAIVTCGSGGFTGDCVVDGNSNTCHEPWDDDNNHGTHCAGIANARDNGEGVVGVSSEATLHAVKVFNCSGTGSNSDVAAGIEYTADQGWDVASMSLGGSKSQVVADAAEYAHNNGVLLVAAAGNSGPCSDCVGYPAAEPEVIAVTATDSNDDLAEFSSTGPEVELAAPGVDILSTVPGGYEKLSGTSMSCPHVSGAGGQLMANGYTNTEARDQLGSTAEDISLSENEQGKGLLDVAASLGLDSSDNL